MRKILFALTAILAIFFLMEPMAQMQMVKGNWQTAETYIYVQSPRLSSERIYQNSTVDLEISVTIQKDSPDITGIYYSLDGSTNRTLILQQKSEQVYFAVGALKNLTEGNHTLMAYSLDALGRVTSTEVPFTVNTSFTYPTISIISPVNQSYSTNEVPLTYSIDAQVKWAYYALDNSDSKAFSGNMTLTGLSAGPHQINVSALTAWGYAEQVAYFNVSATQTSNPLIIDNQTNTSVIAVIAITIATVVAIIAYKRKNSKRVN